MYSQYILAVIMNSKPYFRKDVMWQAVKFRTHVSSCLELVSWMYVHLGIDVHSGKRVLYRELKSQRLIHLTTEFSYSRVCVTCVSFSSF